jgi:small-conductance mechanosensitive channel/CRP-like cAMP-binding protein
MVGMGFELRAAEAVGLAVSVCTAVWLGGRFLWRKSEKPPSITLGAFSASLGLWMAAQVFYPSHAWTGHLGAAVIFCGALFGWVIADRIVSVSLLEKSRGVPVPIILRQSGGVLVVLVALAGILKWGYGLQVTGLMATSGIAAVILGFAMQDLLSNVIAGFSIHTTRAYQVGDWLLMGSEGKRAEVVEINWRSTRLLDNDRISYELPNSDIVKNRIVNLNRPGAEHGARLTFGLDYDTPPALAKEVILKAAKEAQGVLEMPAPVVFTRDFADSSVIYELRFWMRQARLYNIACDEIRTALWYEMGRRGLRVPFPTRSLEVRQHNHPETHVSARKNAALILRGGSALVCLTECEAEDLAGKGRFQLFGPREAIITRGEDGASMFLILDGEAEVIGKTAEGSRVVLAKLGVGDCFGEMSLLTGEPRNATVRAASDMMALEIRKDDLLPLIAGNPELADRLAELIETRRIRRAESLKEADVPCIPVTGAVSAGHRSLAHLIREFFRHT